MSGQCGRWSEKGGGGGQRGRRGERECGGEREGRGLVGEREIGFGGEKRWWSRRWKG